MREDFGELVGTLFCLSTSNVHTVLISITVCHQVNSDLMAGYPPRRHSEELESQILTLKPDI